jgi:hypothetical protein
MDVSKTRHIYVTAKDIALMIIPSISFAIGFSQRYANKKCWTLARKFKSDVKSSK